MEDLTARTRTGITLCLLAVVVGAGLLWGWSQVTEPLPAPLETAPCSNRAVQAGDTVTPSQVMVSVLNAGGRNRLAGDTMNDLTSRGFAAGELGNAPANAATTGAVIWAAPDDIGALLVATHLGGDVDIVDQPSSRPGVTVLVGQEFGGVRNGEESITAADDGWVCVPN